MNKLPVILDCDNTMGVPGCDIDDGLALLYLLACKDIELLGICCEFGNSTQSIVYENTSRLLQEWGRSDIPLYRGAESTESRASEASQFLVEQARTHSGELIIVATGSLSNLFEAYQQDEDFFSRVKCISIMGGITEELLVGGKLMAELNLSSDPEASLAVLTKGQRVMLATAQSCLKSFFPRDEWNHFMKEYSKDEHGLRRSRYLNKKIEYWFDYYSQEWKLEGFVNWDLLAAAQILTDPTIRLNDCVISPSLESLEEGMLMGNGGEIHVLIPEIVDTERYTREAYKAFFKAQINI